MEIVPVISISSLLLFRVSLLNSDIIVLEILWQKSLRERASLFHNTSIKCTHLIKWIPRVSQFYLAKCKTWWQDESGNRDQKVNEINRPIRLSHQDKTQIFWHLVNCGTYSKGYITSLLFFFSKNVVMLPDI